MDRGVAKEEPDNGTPVGYENMIQMDNLTEETLLRNLELRYNHDLIYVSDNWFNCLLLTVDL